MTDRLADMWAGLADAYGNAFVNQFGESPNESWATGLSVYPVEKIMNAVGSLIMRGEEYAPNLATVIREINALNSWEHKAQSRSVAQALSAPVIDLGEKRLPGPEDIAARELGDPLSNPDYFKQLLGK